MKYVLTVIGLVAFAIPASAQMGGGRHHKDAATAPDAATQKKKADAEAKAAKAAMEKIPDSKEKYDPWKIGR